MEKSQQNNNNNNNNNNNTSQNIYFFRNEQVIGTYKTNFTTTWTKKIIGASLPNLSKLMKRRDI